MVIDGRTVITGSNGSQILAELGSTRANIQNQTAEGKQEAQLCKRRAIFLIDSFTRSGTQWRWKQRAAWQEQHR
jgi:hypothetical protein